MQPPYLSLSLWDPVRGNRNILDSIKDFATGRGGEIVGADDESIIVKRFPTAGLRRDYATRVEIVSFSHGDEQVEVTMPLGEYAESTSNVDPVAWRPLATDVLALIQEISPAIAAVGYDFSAASLPSPNFEDVYQAIIGGWIDLRRCSEQQRSAFDALIQRNIASREGNGAWWCTWSPLNLAAMPSNVGRLEASAAIYEALSGNEAPEEPQHPEPIEIVDLPQLWYWRPDAEVEVFTRVVSDALKPLNLEPWIRFDDYPIGWLTGCAEVEAKDALTPALLRQFRRTLEVIRPKWAGIISSNVDWPLGVILEELGESIGPPIADLWVDRSWAHPILPDLESLFQGAHREEIANGILWVTHASLVPDAVDRPGTSEEIRNRELEIAATLGRAVRQSVIELHGPEPGFTEAPR